MTRELLLVISLFRNPFIELPIPVQYFTIPCILTIFQIYVQNNKETLFDEEFNINIK
jgi:hypothetical protein